MDSQPSNGSTRSGPDGTPVEPAWTDPAPLSASIAAPEAVPPSAAEQASALESLFSGRRLDSIGSKGVPAAAKGLQGPPRRRLPRLVTPAAAAAVEDPTHA